MLVPGWAINGGLSVIATAGPAVVVSHINQGFGFTTGLGGRVLAIDTDSPAGDAYYKGFRMNPTSGAVYGTTTTAVDDVFIEGIRVTTAGQLVYEDSIAASFNSGNPLAAGGPLAVVLV